MVTVEVATRVMKRSIVAAPSGRVRSRPEAGQTELLRGSRVAVAFVLLAVLASGVFGQQTRNLEIIWVKHAPENMYTYGHTISSGDFNGDGFSDIVFVTESIVSSNSACYRAMIFNGGVPFDTLPDLVIARMDSFGFLVAAGVGDINGDGFDDLALASPYHRVYVYLGGSPMDTVCDYVLQEPALGFGWSVAGGDLNGDGYNDIIVGAAYAYGPHGSEGAVYVYYGSREFDTQADLILPGGHEGQSEGLGSGVASGGDVNGDGYEDLVAGAVGFGGASLGRIYVYYGGNPMDTTADVAMIGPSAYSGLGESGLAILRRDDDFDCVAAGAHDANDERGRVYVLYGGHEMDSVPDLVIDGPCPQTDLGRSTASGGRFNGGRYDALLAGALYEQDTAPGMAYVWMGQKYMDTIPCAWMRGDSVNDWVGEVMHCAGDVDGDGLDEIVVGNYSAFHGTRVRVWVCKYASAGNSESRPRYQVGRALSVTPNPCRRQAVIEFCPGGSRAIRVCDRAGREVIRLKPEPAGPQGSAVTWNLRDASGRPVPNGIYFAFADPAASAGAEAFVVLR